MAPRLVSPTPSATSDTPSTFETEQETLEQFVVETKVETLEMLVELWSTRSSAVRINRMPSATSTLSSSYSTGIRFDDPTWAYGRFPTLPSFALEPHRSQARGATRPTVTGGVVPRRQRPRFGSPEIGIATALVSTATATSDGVLMTAVAPSTISEGPDPLPELPRIPAPLFALLAVLTVAGFVFAALIYFINFPADESILLALLKKLGLVKDERTPSADRYNIPLSPHSSRTSDADYACTTGTSYSYISSPLTQLSPRTAYLPPETAPLSASTSARKASTMSSPDQRMQMHLLSSTSSRQCHPPQRQMTSEREWLAQRAAFDDEAARTPLDSHSESGPQSPLRRMTEAVPSPDTSAHVDLNNAGATTAGLRHRCGVLTKTGRETGKGLLKAFDGAVERVVAGVVRYMDDEGGEEGLLLPITEGERERARGVDI